MNIQKFFAFMCLALVGCGACGCGSATDYDENEEIELGQDSPALVVQLASSGVPGRLQTGINITASPPGTDCSSNSGDPYTCVMPRADKTIRIKSVGFAAIRGLFVASANANLAGCGWTVVADDSGTNNVQILDSASAGNSAKSIGDTDRYITVAYNGNGAMAESPSMPGTYTTMNSATVAANLTRWTSDCAFLYPAGVDRNNCVAQGSRHIAYHGLLTVFGSGVTNLTGAVSGYYTSRAMAPYTTAKIFQTTGSNCRACNYNPGGNPSNGTVVFSSSVGCSND